MKTAKVKSTISKYGVTFTAIKDDNTKVEISYEGTKMVVPNIQQYRYISHEEILADVLRNSK